MSPPASCLIWAILSAMSKYYLNFQGVFVSQTLIISFLEAPQQVQFTYLSSFFVIFKEKVQTNVLKFAASPPSLVCTHLSYTYKIALGVVANAFILEAEARGPLQVQGQHGTRG